MPSEAAPAEQPTAGPAGQPTAGDAVARPVAGGDAPMLAELFLAARDAAFPDMPRPVSTREEVHAWFRQQVLPAGPSGRELWVAEQGGQVVGYVVLDPGWLHSLYVHPRCSRRGIGSLLLGLAQARRPDGFGLWVFQTNLPARRFYARHGLLELERTDGQDNQEGAPQVRMVWPGADPVAFLRRQVDEVDTGLGRLLARRTALTAAIQRYKPVAGHPGRDPEREAEIVARMAAQVPELGEDRVARIVRAVITQSLDAAEPARRADG